MSRPNNAKGARGSSSQGRSKSDLRTNSNRGPASGSTGASTASASTSRNSKANGSSNSNNSNANVNVNHMRKVNEVVPKVWVISNFMILVCQQIAVDALKKGDIVVLGCTPGGASEQEVLKKAEKLRQKYPERCLIVELDIR